jgi:ankyrin repeat protein
MRRLLVTTLLTTALVCASGPLSAQGNDGTTPLHWAVRNDDVALVTKLVAAGADVNAANRYGITPLGLAAENGSARVVELLLAAGANPNAAEPEGETPLMTAARTGAPAVIRALVARGANVQAREGWLGQTALMLAVAEDHAEAAAALIAAGADVNARSAPTNLPDLEWDVIGMSTTVFPRGRWTPLMFAAREGAVSAARVLIDRGADLDLQDPDGTTALVLAIINAHYDVAALLLERGANPNIADTSGMAALYAAVDMSTLPFMHNRPPPKPTGSLDILALIGMLLDHKADPNARLTGVVLQRHHNVGDRTLGEGSTPLMRAAKTTDLPVMRRLLQGGADAKLVQKDGTNALMIAATRGEAGGYGRMRGGTEQGAIEAIGLLLEAGLDVNAVNKDGQSALHGVATRADDARALARFLVERGANPRLKNTKGQTPLDAARGGARSGLRTVRNEPLVAVLTELTEGLCTGTCGP